MSSAVHPQEFSKAAMSIVLAHASLGFPFHFSPVVASSLNLLVMSLVTANHEMESEAGVCKNWRACRDNAVPTVA